MWHMDTLYVTQAKSHMASLCNDIISSRDVYTDHCCAVCLLQQVFNVTRPNSNWFTHLDVTLRNISAFSSDWEPFKSS